MLLQKHQKIKDFNETIWNFLLILEFQKKSKILKYEFGEIFALAKFQKFPPILEFQKKSLFLRLRQNNLQPKWIFENFLLILEFQKKSKIFKNEFGEIFALAKFQKFPQKLEFQKSLLNPNQPYPTLPLQPQPHHQLSERVWEKTKLERHFQHLLPFCVQSMQHLIVITNLHRKG